MAEKEVVRDLERYKMTYLNFNSTIILLKDQLDALFMDLTWQTVFTRYKKMKIEGIRQVVFSPDQLTHPKKYFPLLNQKATQGLMIKIFNYESN